MRLAAACRILHNEMNDTKPSTKKTPKTKPASRKPTAAQMRKAELAEREKIQARFRRWGTIVLSVMIPLFSMSCARFAGSLLHDGTYWLAVLAGGLAVTSLVVSLSHLAEAIELITGSSTRPSRALALAFDGGVILSELTHAVSEDPTLQWVAMALLIALTGLSMALNWYAFKFGAHGTDAVQ